MELLVLQLLQFAITPAVSHEGKGKLKKKCVGRYNKLQRLGPRQRQLAMPALAVRITYLAYFFWSYELERAFYEAANFI